MHHLLSLLAVHLVRLAQRWLAARFRALNLVFGAFCDGWRFVLTSLVEFNLARCPGGETYTMSIGVRALALIQDRSDYHFYNQPRSEAMLRCGQKCSKDKAAALAIEPDGGFGI
jgi:hypothetical protein